MPTLSTSICFPGETAEYRRAREELLVAERELRRNLERVAAKRRKLPLGGEVSDDYVFDEAGPEGGKAVRSVRLSELFEPGNDTLILYSFMYGPGMREPCPSCSSILDGLDGATPHVRQRVNLAVIARSPIERIREFAGQRGWRNLRLLSSSKNTYNRDYYGEDDNGDQWPSLNVFVRRNGRIHHFYHTELLFAEFEEGQESRHVDLIWPIWNLFDLTPEGRGTDWNPRLTY